MVVNNTRMLQNKIYKRSLLIDGSNRNKIGDVYVKNAGYLEVAEANAIIVLFPQTISTVGSNPNGCFDWWGYDDPDYETQNGNQMDAIWRMVKTLGYNPL